MQVYKILSLATLILLTGAGCTGVDQDMTSIGSNEGQPNLEVAAITEAPATGAEAVAVTVDIGNDMVQIIDQTKTVVASVKEFTVTGGNFAFTPNVMSVKKGDTVRITFKNLEGFHDFKLDEFEVATPQISGGSEEVVEFVADKTGSFEYYCSVGKHRELGMKGTLTVTD